MKDLRRLAEAAWKLPVSDEQLAFLYSRFSEEYPQYMDSEAERMFLSDYEDFGRLLSVYDGERVTGSHAGRGGKRGTYKKCLLEALAVVSFVGSWRMSQHAAARIPFARLVKKWNSEHPGHNKSRDAFKGLYYHRRKDCIRFALESTIERLEREGLPGISAMAEGCRMVLEQPGDFDVDLVFTADSGLALRITPKHPAKVRLPGSFDYPCACPSPHVSRRNKETGKWECAQCGKPL